jgi:hypothetical protein
MLRQVLAGSFLMMTIGYSTMGLQSARADMTAWPQGCFAPPPDYSQLQFEYDTSELSHVEGIDLSRLNNLLAHASERYLGEGRLAIPVHQVSVGGNRDRAIIIATLFPLLVNAGTDRPSSPSGGLGNGIIQGYLSRSLTYDQGVVVTRDSGPADAAASAARSEAMCITQFVTETGLITCGIERLSSNAARIRELLAVSLGPLIDIRDNGAPWTLVADQDYVDRAVRDCLDYLGPKF